MLVLVLFLTLFLLVVIGGGVGVSAAAVGLPTVAVRLPLGRRLAGMGCRGRKVQFYRLALV